MNDYSKITALYSRLSVGNAMEIFRRNNMRFIAVNNGIDNEMPEVPLPAHHGRGFTHADRFGRAEKNRGILYQQPGRL